MSIGSLTAEELGDLQPYLDATGPRENGEWDLHCPLHDDMTASASMNVESAEFYCQACRVGGPVGWLISQKDRWVPRVGGYDVSRNGNSSKGTERLSKNRVDGWHDNLIRCEPELLQKFIDKRGINKKTLSKYKIGYDGGRSAYTIPIYDDVSRLVNVRRYVLDGDPARRKIWSVQGHGKPTLYPLGQLKYRTLIVCEGEWDALLTIQNGFHAITRTGAADVWRTEWSKLFQGKDVFLCHDADDAGQAANMKIAKHLTGVAARVRFIKLPYGITEKHGKDLTDFWAEHTVEEFNELLEAALDADDERANPLVIDPTDVSVMDASDPDRVGVPIRLTVTVRSRSTLEYSVPKDYTITCPDDGRCEWCPALEEGEISGTIENDERMLLQLQKSTDDQIEKIIKRESGIPSKCHRCEYRPLSYHSLINLEAIPSIDHNHQSYGGEYKRIGITSSASHMTPTGITIQAVGALHPDPRTQANRFLAWNVTPLETSLDRYSLTDEQIELCKKFQADSRGPLHKLGDISKDISKHVTRIHGRTEMHVAMDLVFHSALRFKLDGKADDRGWMELLIVGDTRTGKSEAAQRMIEHYRVGQLVSCETATIAGIMGGADKGSDDQWVIAWGAMPLNDRRLVVLDEVKGMTTEQIGSMSQMRSSGIAHMQKIVSETSHARTRAIWMSNPREKTMRQYSHGVDALEPLIGSPEDIARFDLAMTVAESDVTSDKINKRYVEGEPFYTSEMCEALLHWAWSRKEDEIVWTDAATDTCLHEAHILGQMYISEPPLVQGANIRVKLSRLATAIAMRLFSTDETFTKCVVKKEHVTAAVAFMNTLYGMNGFGYKELSEKKQKRRATAEQSMSRVANFLMNREQVVNFLANCGDKFKMFDLRDVTGDDPTLCSELIDKLVEYRMLEHSAGFYHLQSELRTVLRRLSK